MNPELKEKLEKLRGDYTDATVNYLKSISASIDAPAIHTGCFCKESSRIEFSQRFYMWFDAVKNFD